MASWLELILSLTRHLGSGCQVVPNKYSPASWNKKAVGEVNYLLTSPHFPSNIHKHIYTSEGDVIRGQFYRRGGLLL
jgi:hypothetical protein